MPNNDIVTHTHNQPTNIQNVKHNNIIGTKYQTIGKERRKENTKQKFKKI